MSDVAAEPPADDAHEEQEVAYGRAARKGRSLPGAGIRYGACTCARPLNSVGTSAMKRAKVAGRSSAKVASSSPTDTSYPSLACRRMASLRPNASTRVV